MGKLNDLNDPQQLEELWAWMMKMQGRLNQFDPNSFSLAWIEGAAAGQVIQSMGVSVAPVWEDEVLLKNLTLSGLTASQLVVTNASKILSSLATITVALGGTGAGSFTDNGVIYGNATAALGATAEGATGQVLTGSTGNPPAWSSAPTLTNLTLSGLTPSQLVATNGSKQLVSDATNYVIGVGLNTITVSADAPSTPLEGDLWVDSDSTDFTVGSLTGTTSLVAGTSGNTVTLNATGVTLAGTATVWDDLRVTPGSFDRPGVSDPSIVAYAVGGGANTYLWEFQVDDIASFTVQLPHSYKQGTDIYAHIHWTPGTRGNEENGATVGWKLDYTWANIEGAFGALATADLSDACDGTDHKHHMTPEVALDGHTAAKTISSMLLCNIKRTDAGTDDTWAGTASGQLPMLLEIDFHFEMDTLGSNSQSSKT